MLPHAVIITLMEQDFVGIISDTHGLVRPQALSALRGARLIIHAGDIGASQVLQDLREIAPVRAVRGNVDKSPWSERLPSTEVVHYEGFTFYLLHDLDRLDLDPAAAGFSAVISGHSHRPAEIRKNGVLYLNPGSAGPRRFNLPVTLARLRIEADGKLSPEFVKLEEAI